jgi:hypothetical protein
VIFIVNFDGFNLDPMLIDSKFIDKISNNVKYNSTIKDYYYKLAGEVPLKKDFYKYCNKADRLGACNQFWSVDSYEKQHIRDYLKTYLCRDQFCSNCKKVRQAQRMNNYLPLFQLFDKDLYFITITVPNCQGSDLNNSIKKLFSLYNRIVDCFSKKNKLFENLGFMDGVVFRGSVRSLEVTYRKEGRFRFHPHLHCAFVLHNYILGKKYKVNRFSYAQDREIIGSGDTAVVNRVVKTLFSRDELKLQKLAFLFYTGYDIRKINNKYLDSLKKNDNLSLTIDKFRPGQYKEMFKYMIKDNFNDVDKKDDNKLDYETFKILLFQLRNVRQIQGCGVFLNVTDERDFELEEEVDNIYNVFIFYLKQIEQPIRLEVAPDDIKKDIKNNKYVYISRKKVFGYLRSALLDEKFSSKDIAGTDTIINYTFFDVLLKNIIAQDEDKSNILKYEFMTGVKDL